MEAKEIVDPKLQTWRTKALVFGVVLGALIGLGGAYLLVKNAERKGGAIEVSTGEGVRLGLLVMGLLRQITELGE